MNGNGNGNALDQTSMGSNGNLNELKTFVGAKGTGIQAELSKLFRLENRTIICKTGIRPLIGFDHADFEK